MVLVPDRLMITGFKIGHGLHSGTMILGRTALQFSSVGGVAFNVRLGAQKSGPARTANSPEELVARTVDNPSFQEGHATFLHGAVALRHRSPTHALLYSV